MNKEQQAFLWQLGQRIPLLFEAIARGNVKSEFIIGVRTINGRQVRLKLVAEVVDSGSNPLATHGQARSDSAAGSLIGDVLPAGSDATASAASVASAQSGSGRAVTSGSHATRARSRRR